MNFKYIGYIEKNTIYNFLYGAFLFIGFLVLIKVYLDYVDREAYKISIGADISYTSEKEIKTDNAFYELDIATDLNDFIEKQKEEIKTITYKIENESFYLIIKNNDGIYSIDKIVDLEHNINSKMNYHNIKKIDYKTGNKNNSTVLKLYNENSSTYFVLTDDGSYFLGPDIDEIVFKEDRFFYKSYNPDYTSLASVTTCSDEVKENIENFNSSDYYYKEGKINFLSDYYQKIDAKNYTVNEKCNSLKA